MTIETADVHHLLDHQLRPVRAIALAALGGAGLAQAILLTTLMATEPTPLPTDTTVALSSIACGGLAWAAFAFWRLRNRHALLIRERVVALSLATTITALTTIGAVTIGLGRDHPTAALAAAGIGAAVLTAAGALLVRAWSDLGLARKRLAELEAATPPR